MYQTIKLYLFILFLISFLFSEEKIFYYDTSDKTAVIHEVLLELDEFSGMDAYNEKSIYLQIVEIDNKEVGKVIEWNLNALRLKRSNKYEEGFSGSSKNKFTKTLIKHNFDKTLLEIPLIGSLEQDDELVLKNLPIIFKGNEYCHKAIKMSIGTQSKLDSEF